MDIVEAARRRPAVRAPVADVTAAALEAWAAAHPDAAAEVRARLSGR